MKYTDKLRDPRWQKKRLEIFERDGWTCQECKDTGNTLSVHHKAYHNGLDPWEYNNDDLTTLCETCHEIAYLYAKSITQTDLSEQDLLYINNNPEIFKEFHSYLYGLMP